MENDEENWKFSLEFFTDVSETLIWKYFKFYIEL